MYSITYQLLDIKYVNHKFIVTDKSDKHTYYHEFHKLNNYLTGGINMTEWKEARKLLFIYNDKSLLFLYINLRLKEIKKAIDDKMLTYINYSTTGYLKSEYRNMNRLQTEYDFNNKSFQIAYHIGNLIRRNIKMEDLSAIVNSDCHGDNMQFILPYVISKSIINFNITKDYKLTYYTKFNNIIHINNGDYYVDTNHIHKMPMVAGYIYDKCCRTANKVIQTLMLSILSDSICYRLRAYFIMGNHDKLSFLKDSVLWISNETKINNVNSSIMMDRYLSQLCDMRKIDYKMKYDIRSVSINSNNVINTDTLIDNICIYLYLNIGNQIYLFQHGILKPLSKMKEEERLISDPRLISYELIDMFRDVYCLKMNRDIIEYRRIYETEIDIDTIDTIGSNVNLLEVQQQFIKQIFEFKTIFKHDVDMNLPIIIVGHNKNYDFLKLHQYKNKRVQLMNKNVFDESHIQDNRNETNDILLAKIILNDSTSHELKSDLIFDELFSIDSYYDSSIVEALKDLNLKLANQEKKSFDEKKQLVDREFSYPYYIQKLSLKGGADCNMLILILILVFIIIIVVLIVYNHEQTISMAAYRKNERIRR